jgi:hypothetical protein
MTDVFTRTFQMYLKGSQFLIESLFFVMILWAPVATVRWFLETLTLIRWMGRLSTESISDGGYVVWQGDLISSQEINLNHFFRFGICTVSDASGWFAQWIQSWELLLRHLFLPSMIVLDIQWSRINSAMTRNLAQEHEKLRANSLIPQSNR